MQKLERQGLGKVAKGLGFPSRYNQFADGGGWYPGSQHKLASGEKKLVPKGLEEQILSCPPGQEDSQFSARRTPRCCRWWPGWTHTLPGTTACSRSRWCCSRRWCRCCWCSHHRNSGPPLSRHSQMPRRKWSPGPADPRQEG